jgi:hypothetical protein
MDPEIQKMIRERTEALPTSVKRALSHIDVSQRLWEIAKEAGLRIDQAGALETETVLVLLGLQHPDSFIGELSKSAGITEESARAISFKVNEQIFKAVRSALAEDERAGATVSSPADTAPPAVTAPARVLGRSQTGEALGTDIAQAKLGGGVHLPSDTIKVAAPAPTPTTPPPPLAPKTPPSIVSGDTYTKGADPYREPTK